MQSLFCLSIFLLGRLDARTGSSMAALLLLCNHLHLKLRKGINKKEKPDKRCYLLLPFVLVEKPMRHLKHTKRKTTTKSTEKMLLYMEKKCFSYDYVIFRFLGHSFCGAVVVCQ